MDNLTQVGKLFFTSLIGWINNGHKLSWKLKASPEKMEAFSKIILATKNYQDEIKKPDATVDSVIAKMQEKNDAAEAFRAVTGSAWPL